MLVKRGEKKPLEIQNKTIKGFAFIVVGALISEAAGTLVFDLSKIIVSAILHRKGQRITLFQEQLLPLVIESAYYNGAFEYTQQGAAGSVKMLINSDVDQPIYMLPLHVDLGMPINLKKDDKIVLDIKVNNDAYKSSTGALNTVDSSQCSVEVYPIETVGLEFFTPVIETQTISQGESRVNIGIGENVRRITFANLETSDFDFTDSPIDQVQLISDKLNYSKDIKELFVKRAMEFASVEDANIRKHTFALFDASNEVELDKCALELTLIPAKVDTGSNFIVTRKTTGDVETYVMALQKSKAHAQEFAAKLNS